MVAPSRSGELNLSIRKKLPARRPDSRRSAFCMTHGHQLLPTPESQRPPTKTRISDVLRWKMVDAKNRLDPIPEMQFLREPQSDRAELDTPMGLIDIMVSYTWDESTYLTMECKRITSKKTYWR